MPRDRLAPSPEEVDTERTDYANQEPEYKAGEFVETISGTILKIISYDKLNGLYEVQDMDDTDVAPYTIRPDRIASAVFR